MCSYCRGLWQLLFIAATLSPSQPSQAQDSLPPSSSLLRPSGTPLPMELGVQLPHSLAPFPPTPCTATDPQPRPWLLVPGLSLAASVSPLGMIALLLSLR